MTHVENSDKMRSDYLMRHLQEGGPMEEIMTDYQYRSLLKTVLQILELSKDKDEAIERVKALLEDK